MLNPLRGSRQPSEPPAEVDPDGRDGPAGSVLGCAIAVLVIVVAGIGFLLMG